MKWSSAIARMLTGGWGTTSLLFLAVLSILLHGVFLPGHTLFANDGPLGELMAQCHRLPDRFTGCWADLNSVGFNGGAASPDISSGLEWLLGPVWFSKFYAILSLLLLGFGAWCFFRQSRLTPLACVLGGLAAMLNSTFFSLACWGMSPHVLTAGMSFLALAALADTSPCRRWLRLILAGFAVGMGVAEGADVGAIFSLYVAAFIVYQAWTTEGSRVRNLAVGLGRLVLVTACAAFLAAQPIWGLVTTAIKGVTIKGVTRTQLDAQARTQRWNWATQWSLPKREMLSLVVPGLYGYRMDTPHGGNYWGMMGRDPAWDKYFENGSQGPPPTGFLRYSGGGSYAGVLVMLVALWAAMQSLRRGNFVFNLEQRKWLWFWLGVSILSLLLALGRFAPFYQLVYALPYFSTIRNPVKFLYPLSFALVVLFAFGVDGLWRKYMQATGANLVSRWAGLQSWWRKAAKFEKYWVYGCGLVWVASLAAWLVYARQHDKLEQYLQYARVNGDLDSVASFSIHQVGWFILFFFLATGLMVLIFSGAFVGKRARRGGILLGLLLVADLGLANQPWIVYWDYKDKYASNPIIDLLRDKPYEHRVALVPFALPPRKAILRQLYRVEWLQQQLPFYNIQSFDVVEMPRVPVDFSAFAKMLNQADMKKSLSPLRCAWQLTNTRYILAPADFGVFWNEQDDLARTPLRIVTRFGIVPKPGITTVTKEEQLTAVPAANGNFALFEFSDALPRAKLYQHWQVNTNDPAVLEQLFSPAFDPESSVLVDGGLPSDSATETTNPPAGAVEFVRYAPKDLVLKAEVSAPSVLLLNDHFDPNWKVLVDGRPEQLLRCNFLMRGVHLMPGTHQIEFKFQPPVGLLYVSLTAMASGLLALAFLLVSVNKNRSPVPASAIRSPPASPHSQITARPKPEAGKKTNAGRSAKG